MDPFHKMCKTSTPPVFLPLLSPLQQYLRFIGCLVEAASNHRKGSTGRSIDG